MEIHVYDKETGKYMRTQEPRVDVLESKFRGETVYVSYPNSTTEPVPEHGKHEVPYFIDGKWEIRGNYKNVKVYNTESKYFEYCYEDDLGENQVVIDDEEGIKKFEEEPMKWVVSQDFKIVENPNYELENALKEVNEKLAQVKQDYNDGLEEPVVFPLTGKLYKAKWVDDGTYTKIITGAQTGLIQFPQQIWDATELAENMVEMDSEMFTALCTFLALRQKELFDKKKSDTDKLLLEKASLEASPTILV